MTEHREAETREAGELSPQRQLDKHAKAAEDCRSVTWVDVKRESKLADAIRRTLNHSEG